jgi:hypothetical protein
MKFTIYFIKQHCKARFNTRLAKLFFIIDSKGISKVQFLAITESYSTCTGILLYNLADVEMNYAIIETADAL